MEQVSYYLGDKALPVIQNLLYKLHKGDFGGPDPTEEFYIETGLAGLKEMNDAIKQMAINSGFVVNASDIGVITPELYEKRKAVTSYVIPFLARVYFNVDQTFDAMEPSVPFINGWKLTSYNYRIRDINGQVVAEITAMKLPRFKKFTRYISRLFRLNK